MTYIKGDRILDYIKKSSKDQILMIIDRVLEQLYTMDKLKINKQELTNPYKHIIIRNDIPVLIDFERCQYTEKPKNITQFIQFLISQSKLFKEKGIEVHKYKLLDIAKDYKTDINISYLKSIIDCLE